MLAAQSQHLSWRDTLSLGLWRLLEWLMPSEIAQPQPVMPQVRTARAPERLIIDGIEYVNVGRRFPIRADRLDTFYCAAE